MLDNLDKYLTDFDEARIRASLSEFTRDELIDRLIYAYKEKRVIAQLLDEVSAKFNNIHLVP